MILYLHYLVHWCQRRPGPTPLHCLSSPYLQHNKEASHHPTGRTHKTSKTHQESEHTASWREGKLCLSYSAILIKHLLARSRDFLSSCSNDKDNTICEWVWIISQQCQRCHHWRVYGETTERAITSSSSFLQMVCDHSSPRTTTVIALCYTTFIRFSWGQVKICLCWL